ncbi:MAG: hypothetical protein JO047_06535 [Alphaproteobacteria bacterium]|nr:hypothetical protein [Alphaproteobacteria bacterium]
MTTTAPSPAPLLEAGALVPDTVAGGLSGPRGADDRLLPASPRRPRTWRSPLILIAAGGLVALALGSAPLAAWMEALPAPAPLQHAARSWQEATARIGLSKVYAGIGRIIRGWETVRFSPR